MAVLKNAAIASGVGIAAGAAHVLAHRQFGNPQAFGPAGVTQAGLAVVGVTAVGSFLALSLAGRGGSGLQNAAPSMEAFAQSAYGYRDERSAIEGRQQSRRQRLGPN